MGKEVTTLPSAGSYSLRRELPYAYELIGEVMEWSGINQKTAPVTYDRVQKVAEFAVLAASHIFTFYRGDLENLRQRCLEADDQENLAIYERLLSLSDEYRETEDAAEVIEQ